MLKGSKIVRANPKQSFLRSNTFNYLIFGAFVGADILTGISSKNRQNDEISLSKKITHLQGLNSTDYMAIQTLQSVMSGAPTE